jgi:hypothetical protein
LRYFAGGLASADEAASPTHTVKSAVPEVLLARADKVTE